MKKSFFFPVLLFFLTLLIAGAQDSRADESNYSLYVNGVKMGADPVVKNGIVYYPVQVVISAMQMSYEWNSSKNTLKINDNLVNATPSVNEGIILLPVESIAQAIRAVVKWDGKDKRISMNVPGSSLMSVNKPQIINSTSANPLSSRVNTPIRTSRTVPIPKIDRLEDTVNSVIAGQTGIPASVQTLPLSGSQRTTYQSVNDPSTTNKYTYSSVTNQDKNKDSSEMDPNLHPLSTLPQMPSGMRLPPQGPQFSQNVENPQVPAQLFSTPGIPSAGGTFSPKRGSNEIFSVTVTNMEEVNTIKNYYKPRSGSKYIVVYLTQQNVSNQTQIYTGKFSLIDESNKVYEYMEGLSNFWLVILKPGGVNFGYLVFEIPEGTTPVRLVLHALNHEPLAVKLDS
ncbi:MAG: DUF4352 domain-containing protein [Vulcanimicrobiota bacterium]